MTSIYWIYKLHKNPNKARLIYEGILKVDIDFSHFFFCWKLRKLKLE